MVMFIYTIDLTSFDNGILLNISEEIFIDFKLLKSVA